MSSGSRHRRKRKNDRVWIWVLLLVLVLALAGVMVFLLGRSGIDRGGEPAATAAPTAVPAAAPESAAPAAAAPAAAALTYDHLRVVISEIMPSNKAFCADADGAFSDWIELANIGDEAADLGGWSLTDKDDLSARWSLPAVTLSPGEYLRIWTDGQDLSREDGLHASFSVSDGETLTLLDPNMRTASAALVAGAAKGSSLALREDGSYVSTDYPTPGFPNTAAGYEAFCENDVRDSALLLWEVTVYDAAREDWVELKNVSSGDVRLSDYFITDKEKEPQRMRLPDVTLAPGESFPVELEGFGLSADREWVYLIRGDGVFVDWAFLRGIPVGGSYGRLDGQNGFFYFTAQTAGQPNAQGWRVIAAMPEADVPSGVYNDVDSFAVTLRGESMYYTTDGSVPTVNSTPYTAPVTVSQTTILRARSLPANGIPSDTLTLSYFLHENSTLPVVSLVAAPDDLFGARGIYTQHELAWAQDWEREANLSFFEDGGSFSIDCGIQMHGRTSRRNSDKRSFKVEFRGRYGGDLNYDVFGDGKITEFSALLLRASLEDNYTSYMRDELMAKLAIENTDVLAQNYRYVSMFINGEYWGIYAIREHHSKEYFASHKGVDAETVDKQTGEYRNRGNWDDLLSYVEMHGYNLSSPETWEYIQAHVDVPEMIDWLILECWSGDMDVYENVRFYASPECEGGKYYYGLVDMDLTMMRHDTYDIGFGYSGQMLHWIIPHGLLSNQTFRDMFLTRLGELLRGPLSDESVLESIAELRAIVEPESARDLARWMRAENTFASQMDNIRNFVEGRADEMRTSAAAYFGLSGEQIQKYFY